MKIGFEIRVRRTVFLCALLVAATVGLQAQPDSSNPYQGTSHPPEDDQIPASQPSPKDKPTAGQSTAPAPDVSTAQPAPQPTPAAAGTDDGIVQVSNEATANPTPPSTDPVLTERDAPRGAQADPDGDIVRLRPLRPSELPEGTTIRVRLLDQLSTTASVQGEAFRTTVASDVLKGDQVLIPAGAEIDGRVAAVSTGHLGGRGTIRLLPVTVILADGRRFQLSAELSSTPGSRTKVDDEGTVRPGSQLKKDSIEVGGAVGGGAVAGAVIGGPTGAVVGGLIGAGAVTAHLLVSHPQATLEVGTALVFTLTQPLDLIPAEANQN